LHKTLVEISLIGVLQDVSFWDEEQIEQLNTTAS